MISIAEKKLMQTSQNLVQECISDYQSGLENFEFLAKDMSWRVNEHATLDLVIQGIGQIVKTFNNFERGFGEVLLPWMLMQKRWANDSIALLMGMIIDQHGNQSLILYEA